jgi:hypothetical protein
MAMWAFGHEQVAVVMALRETAVIFSRSFALSCSRKPMDVGAFSRLY